jgi:dCMP deaminase
MTIKWDKYFLGICQEVAKNSKCLSRQIGAILVKDKSIVSTGYNGGPRGVVPCGIRHQSDDKLWSAYKSLDPYFDRSITVTKCPRQILGFKSGQGLEWCIAGHAERNVLINAAREGIATKGGKLYMTCFIPCTPCLVEIINAGIEEIIVTKIEYYDPSAEWLLKNSNLKWREYEIN